MEYTGFRAKHVPHYSRVLLSVILSPQIVFLSLAGILLLALSMVGFHYYEVPVNPNITNVQDVLWWGISTVTGVGYGDVYPITPEGKIITSVVMIIGVSLFLGITSVWVAIFLSKLGYAEYRELSNQLDRIENMLKANKPSP